MIDPPLIIMYGCMVFKDAIHIDPTIAALNGLGENAANILNVYFQTPGK